MGRKRKKSIAPLKKDRSDYKSDFGQKLLQAIEIENENSFSKKTLKESNAVPVQEDRPIEVIVKPKPVKRVFIPEKSPTDQVKADLEPQPVSVKKIKKEKAPTEHVSREVKSEPVNLWQSSLRNLDKERDLVIGFDLGTSSTKVVIQDRQLRKAFVVPFDDLCGSNNRYLLPTALYRDNENKLSLKPGQTQIDDLKVNFMKDPDKTVNHYGFKATNQDFIAAYIGLVLIKIREWFWREKSREYADTTINWELNVGIPAKTWNETTLSEAAKKAALAGWNISRRPETSISIKDIACAFQEACHQIDNDDCDEDQGQLHPDLIKPVPELIAEVMGFAQSQLRRLGMYLLVDIGASTMDISTFILHEDQGEENIFTILSSDVQPLGVYNLHKYRINNSLDIYKRKLESINRSYDGISALPEFSTYQPEIEDDDNEIFEKAENNYLNQCSIVLRQVIGHTIKVRNPYSQAWELGVPSFICGGGSQVHLYEQLVPYSGEKLKSTGIKGFDVRKLPKPENLENDDILPQEYHRVAVSYGLSFSIDNMGTIIPERDVEDIVPDLFITDVQDNFIDKDMV